MGKQFVFTQEQLKAIHDGDMDARNAFYFDNLEIIRRMAYCAVQRDKHPTVTVDDLVQGVYVDMDYFCDSLGKPVTDLATIIGFLHWSFHLAPYGGLAYCRENNPKITCKCGNYFDTTYTDNNLLRLDAPIGDSNGSTYGDLIPDTRAEMRDDTTDCTEEYVNTFGQYLSPAQRQVFALVMDGYGVRAIADKLGQKEGTTSAQKRGMRTAFVKNRADVLDTLEHYGICSSGIADREPKHYYKTSAKQRETMRRYLERKRARKNGSNGNDAA